MQATSSEKEILNTWFVSLATPIQPLPLSRLIGDHIGLMVFKFNFGRYFIDRKNFSRLLREHSASVVITYFITLLVVKCQPVSNPTPCYSFWVQDTSILKKKTFPPDIYVYWYIYIYWLPTNKVMLLSVVGVTALRGWHSITISKDGKSCCYAAAAR